MTDRDESDTSVTGAINDPLGVPAGHTGEAPAFFYVEVTMLHTAFLEAWSRAELLVYLMHCRGYNPKCRGSLMGEKGARERLGLTKAPWQAAQLSLEQRGWLLSVSEKGSKRPVTCISAAANPYSNLHSTGAAKELDGHRYAEVVQRPLVKAPWSLIDGSPDGSLWSLADLLSTSAITLALSIYCFARADGIIPLRELWLGEQDESVAIRFGPQFADGYPGDPGQLESAASELLACGFLYAGVRGAGGRWVLHQSYPMAPTTSQRRIQKHVL